MFGAHEPAPAAPAADGQAAAEGQDGGIAKKLRDSGEKVDLPARLGMVMTWKLIGPFPNKDQKGVTTVYPPEKSLDFAAEYDGKAGKVKWVDYTAKDDHGLVDLKEALKDKAEDVRVTSRLVDSPACLVASDGGMSTQLARMLKQAGQKVPEVKPILEVNPEHALVRKLDGSVHFHDLAQILFDQALLAEGGMPEDPAAYVKRVNALLA